MPFKIYLRWKRKVNRGVYPDISLREARTKRDEYKKKLAEGIDPVQDKKQAKHELEENVANTFENIALKWHKHKWKDSVKKDAKLELSRLKRHIFPYLGSIPIKKIAAQQLISTIRNMEDNGILSESQKTRSIAGQVFKYAIVTKRAEHNLIQDTAGAYKQAG